MKSPSVMYELPQSSLPWQMYVTLWLLAGIWIGTFFFFVLILSVQISQGRMPNVVEFWWLSIFVGSLVVYALIFVALQKRMFLGVQALLGTAIGNGIVGALALVLFMLFELDSDASFIVAFLFKIGMFLWCTCFPLVAGIFAWTARASCLPTAKRSWAWVVGLGCAVLEGMRTAIIALFVAFLLVMIFWSGV